MDKIKNAPKKRRGVKKKTSVFTVGAWSKPTSGEKERKEEEQKPEKGITKFLTVGFNPIWKGCGGKPSGLGSHWRGL